MEQSVKKPSFLKILFAGALSVFSAVLTFLLAVSPAYLSHLLYTGGALRFFAVSAVCASVSFYLFGAGSLITQACVIIIALLICAMMKRRSSYFEIALYSAAAITIMLYLMTNLQDLLAGAPPFHTFRSLYEDMWAQAVTLMRETPGAFQPGAFTEEMLDMYENYGYSVAAMMPTYMPAVICALGAAFGLLNVCIAARLNDKAGADIKPMSKFMLWKLPNSFTSGAAIMVAGLIVASLIGVTLDPVIPAVAVIIIVPFAVQGFCFFRFVTLKRKKRGIIFGVFVALTILTFPTSMITLSILGLGEQLFNMRRRIIKRDGSSV